MKPKWEDAPEWANYLAKDGDDQWYWFENQPILRKLFWSSDCNGKFQKCYTDDILYWRDTLEERPK